MFLTKRRAREIRKLAGRISDDFIPKGMPVKLENLRFRRTREDDPLYHCCRRTGYDIQSGPIYCGDIGEFVAIDREGYVGLCERHKPPESLIVL